MLAFINSVLQSLILLISYISNHNSFPKPLSKEEEAECLRLMAEGDEEAKNKLIEQNLRLVAHVAKKNIRRQPRAPATAKTYCP